MNEVDSFNHVNGIILFCHFNFLKSKTKNIERLRRGEGGGGGILELKRMKSPRKRRAGGGGGALGMVPRIMFPLRLSCY